MRLNGSDDDEIRLDLDEGPGPARPLSAEAARRMVQAALEGGGPELVALPPRRRGVRPAWLLIAAALAITAAAAAGVYRRVQRSGQPSPAPSPSASIAPSGAVAAPEPPPSASVSASPAPEQEEPDAGAPEPVRRPVPVDPGALLEKANHLRAQKKWRQAEAAYQRVIQVAPGSAEAQAARVAAAALRLDQLHDPQGAERLFDQAEKRGGALTEEAAWGLVEARRARGDREGEARALRQFVQSFPAGAMAPRARSRLAELSSPAR